MDNYSARSITTLLEELSRVEGIALSTLKYNCKVLKNLNLLAYENVELTELGKFVTQLILEEK